MIYSDAFDALPAAAKREVYARMAEVFAKKDTPDTRAVVEILRETKKGLPAEFGAAR
jgi:hypothetical protein